MNKLNYKNKKNGFAILEMIFYVCFFAILSIAVINAMITMMKSFKKTQIQSELVQGSSIMERMAREIRQANSASVNTTNANRNNLTLNNTVGTEVFNSSSSTYDIQMSINGASSVNLNPSGVKVLVLRFTPITTLKGSAIRIYLEISSTHDITNHIEYFYDTVVLRGDY